MASVAVGAGRDVAIVVPAYRDTLAEDEQISLRQLRYFLGRFDRYLLAPRSLRLSLPDFERVAFPDRFFTSRASYSSLLLAPRFYETFRAYRYVLVYQLDSLVFSDRLLDWCTGDVDFIGAPGVAVGWPRATEVRNGGFSLRRVDAFLSVLGSRAYWMEPEEYWRVHWSHRALHERVPNLPRKYLKRLRRFNGVRWETARWARGTNTSRIYGTNEDFFWSLEAKKYDASFTVAPIDQALRFAFEANPQACWELNGKRLPFGCHGWAKYGRAFWEPYLVAG